MKNKLTAKNPMVSQSSKRKISAFFAKPLLPLRLLLFFFLLASCNKPDHNQPAPSGDYQHGVWFINEGGFMYGNASLDFYHKDKDTLERNVFENVNGKPLGDVLQSMYHFNSSYYLVVNNSNELLVTDDKTLKVSSFIQNIIYPRYFLPVSGQKAYVTDNTGRGINVINLQSNTISGQIPYNPKPDSAWASWTEEMVQWHNNVYVAAVKTGKILVVNTVSDNITNSIGLSIGLKDLVLDAQNRIWALCDGTLANPFINSKLYCLDTTGKILKSYTFPDINTSPGNFTINATKDTLYYLYGSVYKMGINESNLPATNIISGNSHSFYGLGVDPSNSDIYVGDDLGFSQPGIVFQYNSSGKLLKTHHSGVGPNGFLFVK